MCLSSETIHLSQVRLSPVVPLEYSTEDQDGVDPKIIAVPLSRIDRSFSAIEDITDIPEQLLIQLKHFVEHHKDLEEGKYTKVGGLKGRHSAENTVSEAINLYNKTI